MNETAVKPVRVRKTTFGILALACFWLAAGLFAFFITHIEDLVQDIIGPALSGGADGFSLYQVVGTTALLLWLLGPILAVVSVVRGERTRWPAISGLLLSLLPWGWWLFALAYNAIRQP